MMSHPIDKLFKEKLETISRPAPADAWSRIEAGLHKKKTNVGWLRAAAAVLVLAVASFLLWPSSDNTPSSLSSSPTSGTSQHDNDNLMARREETPAPAASHPKEAATPEVTAAPGHTPATATPAARHEQKMLQPVIVATRPQAEGAAATTTPAAGADVLPVGTEEAVALQTSTHVEPAVQRPQNFKLVIDVNEANDKYLDKKSLAQATSDDQKSSSLKKLLNKAHDLKTNQNSFGELRHMKNEILALNFQGNKKHEQTK